MNEGWKAGLEVEIGGKCFGADFNERGGNDDRADLFIFEYFVEALVVDDKLEGKELMSWG